MDGLGRVAGSPAPSPRLPVMDWSTFKCPKEGEPSCQVQKDADGNPLFKTYLMSPLRLKDMGALEQYVLDKRPDPGSTKLAELCDKLPPHLQKIAVEKAVDKLHKGSNKVTKEELAEFVDTFEGMAFAFWLSVRRENPEIDSFEKAMCLFSELDLTTQQEVHRAQSMASGTDVLGKATGPTSP